MRAMLRTVVWMGLLVAALAGSRLGVVPQGQLSLEELELASALWGVDDARQFPIPLIFPGTKWCGDGSVAKNYSDLGIFTETDKCCRDHDNCPEYIPGFGTNSTIGLHNTSPFTRCECDCDRRLSQCLKDVNSPVSTMVGLLFDNILQIKCYKFDFPIVGCTRYGGLGNRSCQEYVFDRTAPKIWQFFDAVVYNGFQTDKSISDW